MLIVSAAVCANGLNVALHTRPTVRVSASTGSICMQAKDKDGGDKIEMKGIFDFEAMGRGIWGDKGVGALFGKDGFGKMFAQKSNEPARSAYEESVGGDAKPTEEPPADEDA